METKTTDKTHKTNKPALTGNWEPQNKLRLERLIAEKAFADNYAVFDWDYTCIFYDIQDSLFLYQLEHLCFNLTPEQFAVTIRHEIPQNIPLVGCFNSEGRQLTAADLSADLDDRYRFLYHAYQHLNGTLPLEEVVQTEEYLDFKAKILTLMRYAVTVCDTDISQSVCTGMTLPQLNALVEKTIAEALTAEIKQYTLVSPVRQVGRAGVVTATYRKGIRIQPEIRELFRRFEEHGITPYICSASQEDGVRVFACNPAYGYCLRPEQVFGRRRLRNTDGVFTDERDYSIPQTWREGKAEAIRTLIAPRHGGKAPILVAGDSDGDFCMMDAFKNEALLLILYRNQKPHEKLYPLIQRGLAERNAPDASIIVQHRNEETGLFISGVSDCADGSVNVL